MTKECVTLEQLKAHCKSTTRNTVLFAAGLAGSVSLLGVNILGDQGAYLSSFIFALILFSAASLAFSRTYHEKIVQVIRELDKDETGEVEKWLRNARLGDVALDATVMYLAGIGILLFLHVSELNILEKSLECIPPIVLHLGFLIGIPLFAYRLSSPYHLKKLDGPNET